MPTPTTPTTSTPPDDRTELLRQYAAAADDVRRAVEHLSDEQLDRPPADEPGGWTARQVVHHLADSEMTSAIRLRKLLAEDGPVIEGYDEARFADRLYYDERPLEASLAAFTAARTTTAELLRCLDDDAWSRAGTHTESGPYSVMTWLEIYAAHAHDHADQIRRAVSP